MATYQPVTRAWARPGGSGRGTYTPHYVVGWGARAACGIIVGGYGTTRPHSPYEGDRRCQRCDAASRRDLDAAHAQALAETARR